MTVKRLLAECIGVAIVAASLHAMLVLLFSLTYLP